MRRIERIIDGISTVCAIVGAAAMFVVLVAISADVIRRGVAGQSIPGVLEITEVLMVIFIFLGMAEAQRRDLHVSFGAISAVLSARTVRYLELGGMTVSVLFVGWMIHATAMQAVDSLQAGEYRFGIIAVPIWPARIAISLGLTALVLQFLMRMYRLARARDVDSDSRLASSLEGF